MVGVLGHGRVCACDKVGQGHPNSKRKSSDPLQQQLYKILQVYKCSRTELRIRKSSKHVLFQLEAALSGKPNLNLNSAALQRGIGPKCSKA